jgi:cation diffusion facilitator family transporter
MKKKNSNPVGALKRTGVYMKSSLGVIALALVLAALSAVMTIIGPDKIGKMATIMSDGLFTGIDLAAIAKIGVFLAIIYCLSALFGFIQHYIMAVVTLKMSYRMRGELSEKINRVPQKYFNTTSQGDILSRITNDVSTLQQGLTNSLPTIISAATQFVGCLIMMFVTEWRMALVALCITLLGMVLIVAIMSKSQRYFTARQKSLGELNGYVEEMYSGHEVVRISRAVDKVLDHFDGLNAAVYDANWRSQFLSGVMQPLMNVIGNLAYVAVCVFGSVLAINGTIEFGVIVSFIVIFLGLQLGMSSIEKILTPEENALTPVALVVLVISILAKLWQCLFYRKVGRMIKSESVEATSKDSRNDVIATSVVLLGAVITMLTGVNLDGYMGAAVALFIVFSGVQLTISTADPLLGQAPEGELVQTITEKMLSYPGIIGMHDLAVHNYGVGRCFASAHCEVDAKNDILVSHDLIDNIERDFSRDLGIHMVIHLDPVIVGDARTDALHRKVQSLVTALYPTVTIHDFRVIWGVTHSNIVFDAAVPFAVKDSDAVITQKLEAEIQKLDPDYRTVVTIDRR